MKLRVGTPEEAGFSAPQIERVRSLASGWVEDGVTPSLVVFAARRGVIALHEAFGQLTPDEDSPRLEVDSLFPMASATKPVTATAAMCLVEDGLLGLNRPVADYIPEFVGEGKDAVLVHHLLTHTSGIRDEELATYVEKNAEATTIPPADETQHPDVQRPLSLGYGAPLWKSPGTEMSYSDFNYALLGEVVRRVSGESLTNFAQERIFTPLGMDDTYFVVPQSVRNHVVRRSPGSQLPLDVEEAMIDIPFAWGGVISTALDVATFGQMFLNRGRNRDVRVLSGPTVTAMTRNQIPGIGSRMYGEFHSEAHWGLGWNLHGTGKWRSYPASLQPAEAFCHQGLGGVYLWIDPVNEIVGVYFSINPITDHPTMVEMFVNTVTAAVVDD